MRITFLLLIAVLRRSHFLHIFAFENIAARSAEKATVGHGLLHNSRVFLLRT